mgnify:CR=1 FL=1|jgi:hypothetical protein
MIFTISASQGQGKTTFINDIIRHSEFKTNITVYPTKSARTIVNRYGGDLQKIYSDKNMLCDFQLDILKLHSEVFNYQYYTRFLLVERSFMDILAFSVINLGRFNDLTNWLHAFESACHANQKKIKCNFKIEKTLIATNDGVRPTNDLFNDAYDAYLTRLVWQHSCNWIKSSNRMSRVNEFDDYLIEGYRE